MSCLSPIETLALSKAVKDTAAKAARDSVAEGHYDVDFTVRVSGPLLVAPKAPHVEAQDVPVNRVLAILLEELAPRVRQQLKHYLDRELEGWRAYETDAAPNVVPDLLALADQLLSLAHRERATTKRGNVTAPLTVARVVKK